MPLITADMPLDPRPPTDDELRLALASLQEKDRQVVKLYILDLQKKLARTKQELLSYTYRDDMGR